VLGEDAAGRRAVEADYTRFCKISRPTPMFARMSDSIRRWPFAGFGSRAGALAAVFAGLATATPAQTPPASPPPITAADILRTIREDQAGKHETLDGQLRLSSGKVLPFRLISNGPLVRYQFAGPPPVTVQVHYNEENSQLEEVSSAGGTERMTPMNFDKSILGTDLTYEDLALKFLYWSHATIDGSDSIRTRAAWKLQLVAPSHRTEYSKVELWVDKESGALLSAEATDWQGHLSKRFEVISGQQIDGRWYLKQLRIEALDPANGRVRSRTYLEIKGVEKPSSAPAASGPKKS
jgi:hypothetical protein